MGRITLEFQEETLLRAAGKYGRAIVHIKSVSDYLCVEFDRELERHAAVMHYLGGYKLRIPTGSDKFSIYPSIAKQTRNLVHVKTAGTSYLECLRVIAAVDRPFFRELFDFARSRYPTDRATYHVSGELENVPPAAALSDEGLLELFEQFDARQVLHVTFGSVLDDYGTRLMEVLVANLDLYDQFLQKHFQRHLESFKNKPPTFNP